MVAAVDKAADISTTSVIVGVVVVVLLPRQLFLLMRPRSYCGCYGWRWKLAALTGMEYGAK